MIRYLFLALWFGLVGLASAATANGNDFALAFTEGKGPAGKKAVLDAGKGQPHYFRYLQIMEMEPVTEDGKDGYAITAFEPSSYMDVKFTVVMPVSLKVLREEPVSKPGDGLAVTGRLVGVDTAKNAILLEQTIVRNKDRLSPKMGGELLGDMKPGATFYSYTEGPRPVLLEFRDRDLLARRDEILKQGGPKAWASYLETEIAKRKAARAAAAKEAAKK